MAYKITSACVSCGSCADVCPAGAISQGDDQYVIDSAACLDWRHRPRGIILKGIHKTVSGPILRRFFCLPPGLAEKAVPLYNNSSVQREVTAWSIGNT